MKREFRKHLQKYCDISNWGRMHKPSRGKENYEKGEKLAEDIIYLMLRNEPGYNGTAVILMALAMVRSYLSKAIFYSNAFDSDSKYSLMDKYEKLYQGDWWMMLRHDRMQSIIERFIRGDIKV